MAEVTLSVGGFSHVLTCREGDQERLLALGDIIDAKAKQAQSAVHSASEARIMLMAALLIADELQDKALPQAAQAPAIPESALDAIADRLETLAIALEKLADHA